MFLRRHNARSERRGWLNKENHVHIFFAKSTQICYTFPFFPYLTKSETFLLRSVVGKHKVLRQSEVVQGHLGISHPVLKRENNRKTITSILRWHTLSSYLHTKILALYVTLNWGTKITWLIMGFKKYRQSHDTHNFNVFVNSIKNFWFFKTNLKTILAPVLHPHGHCILRSLWNLVTRGYKYDGGWQEGLKTIKKAFVDL